MKYPNNPFEVDLPEEPRKPNVSGHVGLCMIEVYSMNGKLIKLFALDGNSTLQPKNAFEVRRRPTAFMFCEDCKKNLYDPNQRFYELVDFFPYINLSQRCNIFVRSLTKNDIFVKANSLENFHLFAFKEQHKNCKNELIN